MKTLMAMTDGNHTISGHASAFSILYNEHYTMVYQRSLVLTKEPSVAEDLAQDVFLKLWLRMQQGVIVNNHKAYLLRMTYHEAVSLFRSRQRDIDLRNSLRSVLRMQENDSENTLLHRETERFLHQGIQLLSPQRQKVYQLRVIENWSLDEIASHLDITERTVKSTLTIAKETIRNYMIDRIGIHREPVQDKIKMTSEVIGGPPRRVSPAALHSAA